MGRRGMDNQSRRAQGIEPAGLVPQFPDKAAGGRVKTILKIDEPLYRGVIKHLLPPEPEHEQAAFLFAREERLPEQAVFTVEEAAKLGPGDFEVQEDDYIEM